MNNEQDYEAAIVKFISEEFLSGADRVDIDETTPLMESGILDSLRVALLLTHIRDELGVRVPLALMDSCHFKDVRSIAAMLRESAASVTSEGHIA